MVSSYIYTFAALTAVSAILICSLSSFTATLRTSSETNQLKNLLTGVAAKADELLTLVAVTNSSARVYVSLPACIGNQQYWMRLRNDSSNAWIEGSFGKTVGAGEVNQVFLPKEPYASGQFVAGYGSALLECYHNGSVVQLNLVSVGG